MPRPCERAEWATKTSWESREGVLSGGRGEWAGAEMPTSVSSGRGWPSRQRVAPMRPWMPQRASEGKAYRPALPRCRAYPYIMVLYTGSHITRGDLAAMARPYLGGSPWPPSQVVEYYILSLVCQPDRLPSSL